MKFSLLFFSLVWAIAICPRAGWSYNWQALRVGKSTIKDVKKVLGNPAQEYREQLLYEKQLLNSGNPNDQPVRLDTAVFNVDPKGGIESIFLFPEWGVTDEQLKPFFGRGETMSYRNFLASTGELKIGAGTRPDEKLHYVELNALCEVYKKLRLLVIYDRQDVVTGHYLVKLILFY